MYNLSEVMIARWRVELKVMLSAGDISEYTQREAVRIYRELRERKATEGIKMPATLLVRAEIEGWL
jgi:transcription initiation factor TFIIIB Brf1 subunit/transcription initiation factor TFIIB